MQQLEPITHSAAGQPITILMADDDKDDIELTSDAFKESRLANGFKSVGDGEKLLDYLHQRGEYAHLAGTPLPGLILLDLNMPRMDGREALEQIKADPRLRKIAGAPGLMFAADRGGSAVIPVVADIARDTAAKK